MTPLPRQRGQGYTPRMSPYPSRKAFTPAGTGLLRILAVPVIALLAALPAPAQQLATADAPLLAVVQAHITEDSYTTEAVFREMIHGHVREAAAAGAGIVVFPEYINVFLAALPYHKEISRSSTLAGAMRRISATQEHPRTIRALLREESDRVRSIMDSLYGTLARRYDLHILAGTYFAASRPPASASGSDSAAASERPAAELTNRAVVYAPSGRTLYEQDKVYLTPLEESVLGLSAGEIPDAAGIEIEGLDVGITICRDTFFPVWDSVHEGRDLWIDLRAEGTRWEEGREDFTELLPERLQASESRYGTTAALTGEFLEMFWEGKSSITALQDASAQRIATADTHRGSDLLTTEIRKAATDNE